MMPGQPREDLLSSVLNAYHLRAGFYTAARLCGEWQFGTSGDRRASFHLIGEGSCWLHTRNARAEPLGAGDLVVLPHDDWHQLSGAPTLHGEANRMVMEGEGPFTAVLCGYFEFAAGRLNPMLDALPKVIRVPKAEASKPLRMLADLILLEAGGDGVGSKSVLDRLGDTLFVMVIRHYLSHTVDPVGFLAAMADPRLRKALDAIHNNPAKDWSVERLCQISGMSRTVLTARFTELLGAAPIEYVTRWRMTQAELMLRDPSVTVAHAADRVGYESETSFRKAFKRLFGIGPGAVRPGRPGH